MTRGEAGTVRAIDVGEHSYGVNLYSQETDLFHQKDSVGGYSVGSSELETTKTTADGAELREKQVDCKGDEVKKALEKLDEMLASDQDFSNPKNIYEKICHALRQGRNASARLKDIEYKNEGAAQLAGFLIIDSQRPSTSGEQPLRTQITDAINNGYKTLSFKIINENIDTIYTTKIRDEKEVFQMPLPVIIFEADNRINFKEKTQIPYRLWPYENDPCTK